MTTFMIPINLYMPNRLPTEELRQLWAMLRSHLEVLDLLDQEEAGVRGCASVPDPSGLFVLVGEELCRLRTHNHLGGIDLTEPEYLPWDAGTRGSRWYRDRQVANQEAARLTRALGIDVQVYQLEEWWGERRAEAVETLGQLVRNFHVVELLPQLLALED